MIRKLKPEDLEQVLQIWLEANCTAHAFVPSEYWENNLESVAQQLPQATVYVWEDNRQILGFLGLTGHYIAGLFVSPAMQSKGIGSQLLSYAKQQNPILTLQVYQKNERAIQFYHREQFKVQSKQIDSSTNEPELIMRWERPQQ